ncbi:MAG: hypothetical protein LIP01_04765 [Tannerellaceae bacterium]|nr:hypothetical protein [Tannerellaceae bacterium]
MRKIFALLFALVMLLTMTTTAFAAETDMDSGRISGMTMDEVIAYLESRGSVVDESFADLCSAIIELKTDGMSNEAIISQIESAPTTYSLYDTWGRLTDSEKLLVVTYPTEALAVQSNATTASSSTSSIYGYNGNGDVTDAYRHGYWNALNARDVGKTIAEAFATAHEDVSDEELQKISNGFYGWQHRSMDLHNNEVGRGVVSWYDIFTSDSTLSDRILEQIQKGNMVILVD